MNQNNKLSTYLGFSMKSNDIVYGYDNIKTSSKHIKLIVVCKTLSEKVKVKLLDYATHFKMDLVESKEILGEIISRENCKVVGVCNKHLCRAILELNEEIEIKRGNN